MQYKARTAKRLNYFDSIFKAFAELSKRQREASTRRYWIVYRMYIEPKSITASELAYEYNVDRSTIFRDINKATKELSVKLFGIDSFAVLE